MAKDFQNLRPEELTGKFYDRSPNHSSPHRNFENVQYVSTGEFALTFHTIDAISGRDVTGDVRGFGDIRMVRSVSSDVEDMGERPLSTQRPNLRDRIEFTIGFDLPMRDDSILTMDIDSESNTGSITYPVDCTPGAEKVSTRILPRGQAIFDKDGTPIGELRDQAVIIGATRGNHEDCRDSGEQCCLPNCPVGPNRWGY